MYFLHKTKYLAKALYYNETTPTFIMNLLETYILYKEREKALWEQVKNLQDQGKGKHTVIGPAWRRQIVKRREQQQQIEGKVKCGLVPVSVARLDHRE